MRTTAPQMPAIRFPGWIAVLFVILLVLVALVFVLRSFWYFEVINNDEIGVKIRAGQIAEIVQPGIVYDFGLFVSVVKIRTSAVAVTVTDNELITSDKQRIGLEVTSDVFRPRDSATVSKNYGDYRTLYTNDADL